MIRRVTTLARPTGRRWDDFPVSRKVGNVAALTGRFTLRPRVLDHDPVVPPEVFARTRQNRFALGKGELANCDAETV
jgi:hypothetical protein